MVQDKHNQIYTELITYMREINPNMAGGTTYSDGVKLPYLYFHQIDGSTELTTLSNTEDGINLAFQIEIYTSEGINMARKYANDVREFMIENSFRCRNFMPLTASSTKVSRFVARYERLDV